MTAQEAYVVLQENRQKWEANKAFYMTARQLGVTPRDLARIFHDARRRKQEKREEESRQLSLFA